MAQMYLNTIGKLVNKPLSAISTDQARNKFKVISSALLFIHLLFAVMALVGTASAQSYPPRNYWTFNGSPANKDSMNNFNIDFTSYACGYSIANSGVVGKCVTLGATGNHINAGNFIPDTAFTIEFLFKPGYEFNSTTLFRRLDGAFGASINLEGITFSTNTQSTGSHDLNVQFEGIGRASYGYYVDGNWHHMVFKYSSNTGKKEIYIDGECPTGFSSTVSGKLVNGANTSLFFNQGVTYYKYYGDYDEIATYYSSLPKALIYKHYIEATQQNKGYSYVNNYTGTIPATAPVTGALDMTEFAPGHPNVTVSAIDQMKGFPIARYKPGNTLLKNFNWVDMMYFGGRFQPGVSDAQSVTNSTILNEEMAKNWNYMIQLKLSMDAWCNSWISLANANPQLGTSIITLRAQLYPSNISSQSLASSNYLQNSSGSFLSSPDGNAGSSHKWWRPTTAPSTYENDGIQQRAYLQSVTNAMTRPLTMINENGEVFPWFTDNALSQDPAVVAAKNASGLDYQTYLARRFKENETQSYRDKFMTLPALANTKFTEYGIDGFPQYRQKYSEARFVNSQINNQYYSTPDFYPRWANNWRNWVSAWHGWQWIVDSRYYELQAGDNLFSPFLAAGWDVNEENNMRPAQFLGLVKCLNMIGAEFFYTGYFNEQGNYGGTNPPPGNPANYAWQAAIPSYAQALASRYEELLRHGQVMNGDVPAYTSNPGKPGYTFWAGDLRKLVVIRKHNTLSQYAITGTVQPSTSMIGGAENESTATITLDGQQIKFKVRRQGSTFIYDKTDANNPIFYQIDEWHEKTHPSYWSKDFNLEAELYDNTNTTYSLKTTRANGTQAGDFIGSTTAITFANGQTTFTPMEYNFQPRTTAQATVYLWVRARSKDGSSTGVSMSVDNGASKTINCIIDTAWNWYRYDACSQQAIAFSGLSLANHTIRFTPVNAKLEFDKFMLATSAALILNPAAPNCASGSTATISANGPITFCQGGNVILTASAGTGYTWNNGATTQSITVNQSGNYSVSVAQTGGCSAVSSPITVTVGSTPSAVISASGSTNICQGSTVTLTASAASAYLWSNGAITQAITVSTAGNYTVKITNAAGCTATSSATNVTVTSGSAATITASGALAFCQGASVTLTSSAGNSYLWSNGATTQSISVNQSGTYSVTLNSGGSCSSVSTPVAVSVYSLPTASISANGATSFCQGGSVTLTASSAAAYLWSNGATTQSIAVTTSGNYIVTVTNSNGCTKASNATIVTADPSPVVSVSANGPTTFCQGGSVKLTASAGAGASYLWTPGNLTTQQITVTSSGNYSVVATSTNGCSAQSSSTAVTVNTTPTASITANGSTTFCAGGSVTLSANSGSAYLWSTGATTQSINVTTAGTFSVTVTNGNCSATSTPVTTSINTSTTATITASGATTFCQGGSVTLTASAGTSYLWSNGSTTQAITVNSSGSYSVTVNNGNCTAVAAPKVVTVNALPAATITANGAITFCQGGSVTLTASAGTSYLWSNGATTQSITVNTSGSFSVTVSNGTCSKTSSATLVTVTSSSTATVTASGATTFCQGGNVTLTAIAGSSYLWSNGATTQAITVNTSGFYSVTISNGNCSAVSSAVPVTVNALPVATISTNGTTNLTQGQSVTLTATAGSSYQWLPGGQTTQAITVSTAGSYTVKVTNASGCSATSAATIVTVAQTSQASITTSTGSNFICSGQSLTLTASAGASYMWIPNLVTTQSVTVSAAGTYSVTVLNANGTTSTASVTIATAAKPAIPSVTYTYIPSVAYQLTAFEASANSYVWAGGQTVPTITVSIAGTYNVKAINSYGCISDPRYVKINSILPSHCDKPSMLMSYSVIDKEASVMWNPATSADSFMVSYTQRGTTQTIKKYVRNTSSLRLKELRAGNTYDWNVTAICSNGQFASDPTYFTTLSAPTGCGYSLLNTSTTNVTSSSAQLNWYGTIASQVTVRYKKVGASTYSYQTVSVGSTAAWGYALSGLAASTTYQWSAKTGCGAIASQYTPDVLFTTLSSCVSVGNPSVVSITATSANVRWNGTINANYVQIRFAKEGTADYKYVMVTGNPGQKTISGLSPSTKYNVWVRTICSLGSSSAWSNPATFTTGVLRLSDSEVDNLQLNAYPNPAYDKITYAFATDKAGSYSLKVSDMMGRELVQEIKKANEGTNSGQLDLTSYANGMYLIIIKKGGNESHFRFHVHK